MRHREESPFRGFAAVRDRNAGFSTSATPSVEMTDLWRILRKADLSATLRDDKRKRYGMTNRNDMG